MGDTSLPPGFRFPPEFRFPCGIRFHPTDVELVMYYLKRKVMGESIDFEAISEVDIYKFDPWELLEKSRLRTGDLKLYFFCPMEKKYLTGSRMNRATKLGHWKITGEDKSVTYKGEVVGMRKTLIFHLRKSSKGDRTDWVMHEYRLEDNYLAEKGVQGACVLSVIFEKSGKGPKNGAQYGAPFKEEDWDNDVEVDCVEANVLPSNHDSSVATGIYFHESICVGSSSVSCLSNVERSHSKVLPPGPSNNVLSRESPQVLGGDSLSMMDIVNENYRNETCDNLSHDGNAEGDELTPRENGYDFSTGQNDQFPTVDNAPYIQLSDLNSPLNISAEAGQSQHNPTDVYNSHINSENDRNEMPDNLSRDGNAEGDEFSIYKDLSDFEDLENLDILQMSDLDTPLNISAEAGQSQHNPTDGCRSYINSEQSCYPGDPSAQVAIEAMVEEQGNELNSPSTEPPIQPSTSTSSAVKPHQKKRTRKDPLVEGIGDFASSLPENFTSKKSQRPP